MWILGFGVFREIPLMQLAAIVTAIVLVTIAVIGVIGVAIDKNAEP